MEKQKFFKMVLALTVIFLLTLFNNTGFCAEPSDYLKPLLIDLKGWKAEKPEGSSMSMGGMKMINAIRNYSKGNSNINATIMISNSAMIQGQTATTETSDAKVTSSKINGFNVIQGFNKIDKSGYVLINLAKKTTEGSLFMINYSGISNKEALKIAKKYNWKEIKTTTSKMMN